MNATPKTPKELRTTNGHPADENDGVTLGQFGNILKLEASGGTPNCLNKRAMYSTSVACEVLVCDAKAQPANSATVRPKLHESTAASKPWEPKSISGARYQSVQI